MLKSSTKNDYTPGHQAGGAIAIKQRGGDRPWVSLAVLRFAGLPSRRGQM
jgi:hypothetical protein